MEASYKRIVIIKPSSLGDIIHALPALAALRKKFPDAWIAWIVKNEFKELLVGHPMLNEVLPLHSGFGGWWSLARELRQKGFDLAIDFQGLFRSACLAWWSGAPERIGFFEAREGGNWFYSSRIRIPGDDQKPWRLVNVHAVDRNLALARHLGAKTDQVKFVFPPLIADRTSLTALLKEVGILPEDRLIVLAPGGRLLIKRWPPERFAELAIILLQNYEDIKIALVGAASDWEIGLTIEKIAGKGCINLIGKTRIGELIALLGQAQLLIANDSAPVHIAVACQTPVLAILGPTEPRATGPYPFGGERVMVHPLPCSPCGQRQCQNSRYMECLTSISAEEVGKAAQDMLGAG